MQLLFLILQTHLEHPQISPISETFIVYIDMELCCQIFKQAVMPLCSSCNNTPSFYQTLRNTLDVPAISLSILSPLKVVHQLSDALAYIHARGYVMVPLALAQNVSRGQNTNNLAISSL